MIELLKTGAYLVNGTQVIPDTEDGRAELKAVTGAVQDPKEAAKETIAYRILKEHNTSGNMENLEICGTLWKLPSRLRSDAEKLIAGIEG